MENIVKAGLGLLGFILAIAAVCGAVQFVSWSYDQAFGASEVQSEALDQATPPTAQPTATAQVIVVTATPVPPTATQIVIATPAASTTTALVEGCTVVHYTNQTWMDYFRGSGEEKEWTKFSLQWHPQDTILWITGPFDSTTAAPFVRLYNSEWFIPYRIRDAQIEPVGIFQRSSAGMRHEFSLGETITAMTDAFTNDWLTVEGFFIAPQSCNGSQLTIEPLISHLVLPMSNREQLGWDYFSLRDPGMHYPAGLTVDD